MQNNRYFPMTLIAVAVMSGCSSMPKNQSLTEAHSNYNNVRTNPEVTSLAALELKDAGDTLNKADNALNKDEDDDAVDQLAYIATQQVAIAQQVAKRKKAELAVTNADAKRDATRLEARTAEADAAHALVAQQAMELAALNAKKTERGMVITLNDVLFSTNKSRLTSGGMRNVQKLADFLSQYPQQKVSVEGYTDSIGSESFNQNLSDRRAHAVRTALMDMAIGSDRVATRGYGEEFPVADNETAASRQLNRRVEIILSDENGNIVPR